MSTRSQILVEGHDAIVYRHSDGYPDGPCGVPAMLLPLLARFIKHRGFDKEYLTAHIAHACIDVIQKDNARTRRRWKKEPGRDLSILDQSDFLGVGVEAFNGVFHGDLAYIYIVHETHLEIRSTTSGFWDNSTMKHTKLHSRLNFDGTPYGKAPAKKEAVPA